MMLVSQRLRALPKLNKLPHNTAYETRNAHCQVCVKHVVNKSGTFLKEILKCLGYLGGAVGLISFFGRKCIENITTCGLEVKLGFFFEGGKVM